jgi:hypothetical protein
MKLWEKPSEIIFRLSALPYLHSIEERSPERILKRSLKLLDPFAVDKLKEFVKSSQTQSGGFKNRAGNADLYYTLFGYFLSDALELKDLSSSIWNYVEQKISQNNLEGVDLHCVAILSARTGNGRFFSKSLRNNLYHSLRTQSDKQPVYGAFLSLLSSYYLRDFREFLLIRKQLEALSGSYSLPCPVTAAFLVLQQSFNKPAEDLRKDLLSFYHTDGGFKATLAAPVPDMLSTAVALYALNFAGSDFG